MSQITPPTDTLTAVWYLLLGGKYVIRLSDKHASPGQRDGLVLDSTGCVIGSASDYIYGGSGFSVHTKAFGGYVSNNQIMFEHELNAQTSSTT